ncbi:MBL fold metallo-hydrolase [Salicibibacter cibarius]|uniref:MBL fold metallo-hydrolase n=1 Tax=Salicibibacter cibarius TaxID=2743000 RepID=A0A7T6Z4J0_9BACI|nr:MBL fold metallo-hydrolase [Salicibibacter cibarius]QQK76657.1 MBL fold metallo-hydrolase [Salicibibacter cibarius]
MRLTNSIYLIGSGSKGMNLTNHYDCNVFLLDGGKETAIIDAGAGMEPEKILKNIEDIGFKLSDVNYLFLTHGHADHIGGAKTIKENTGAKIVASDLTYKILKHGDEKNSSIDVAKKAGMYPKNYSIGTCEVDIVVKDKDEIRVGNFVLQALSTPGHCEGHLSFYFIQEQNKFLFGGDLVFYEGKVATQFINDCNVFKLGQSIKKMKDLNLDVLLPGHETVVLKEAQECIEKSWSYFEKLQLPPSIL